LLKWWESNSPNFAPPSALLLRSARKPSARRLRRTKFGENFIIKLN